MFETGRVYNRQRDIHAKYGGQAQSGIVTPKDHPFIFLFSSETGEQHGYSDGWDENGVFIYTGEGQTGDQTFVRGNRSLRDHAQDGKEVFLFESLGKSKGYRFIGGFDCASWEYREGIDREGDLRQVIVFHLIDSNEKIAVKAEQDETDKTVDLNKLRQLAYQASTSASQGEEKQAKRTHYERSASVRAYVIARAEGVCESCKQPAPFNKADGSPYLEPHHTRRVSDGGPDHPRWVGAVCPNCHKEIHHGVDGVEKNLRLEDYLGSIEI